MYIWLAVFLLCAVSVSMCIRHHGSAVYVGMVWRLFVSRNIQRESSASVLQGLNVEKRTGEEKVQTTYQAALTVLPRGYMPSRGKRPRHFPRFRLFLLFFLPHSSSL